MLALIGAAVPLRAEWVAVEPDVEAVVADGVIVVKAPDGWNLSTARPSQRGDRWTRDGLALNELTFFAAIREGEAIYYQPAAIEQDLPKFRSKMLLTDLVELFENTNRIVLGTSVFSVAKVEPSRLGQHAAVRFSYSYAAQDEGVTRKGEAVAAIINGEMYLVNFVAPAIHYFDRDIAEIRQMIATLQLRPPKAAKPR